MKQSCGRTFRKRRRGKLELPPSEIQNSKISLLSKWMHIKGYQPTKKLKTKYFNGSGRGLMAEEAIHPGDAIISIPKNLLITPKSVLNSYLGPLFQRHCPNATGQEILSVFLMCEEAKGDTSDWHPYIYTLPRSYSIPAYFCHHALSVLPKPIYAAALKQIETIQNSYTRLNPLLDELKNTFPIFRDIVNYEHFKWAWSSVNTRCIFIECDDKSCYRKTCSYHLALAPFLDLLNHSIDVQISAGFNKENNCYEIISRNKFKKYSQVFISYGCHDNQKLFLEYGFVIPDNYNDKIVFSLDDIISVYDLCNFPSEGLSKKISFVKDNNLLRNAVCTVDGLSWNLNIILKILTSKYDIKSWNSLLHYGVDHEIDNSKFQTLKRTIVKLKIDEYRLHPSLTEKCSSECSSHQCLIFDLCSIYYSILIKILS